MFTKKSNLLLLFSIVIMAISITLMDFEDWSWEKNATSYIGLLIVLILSVMRYKSHKAFKNNQID